MQAKSFDVIEKEKYLKPEQKPFSNVSLKLKTERTHKEFIPVEKDILLDGIWEMQQSGEGTNCPFDDLIQAEVPGSVHCALMNAGLIPDPYYGLNDSLARAASLKDYTFRKKFTLNENDTRAKLRLSFLGVCERCKVWLNGTLLGNHRGMFGGPDFDVTGIAKAGENELIVLLYGAPDRPRKQGEPNIGERRPWMNVGWYDTAVFNCTYGWHYADIPGLGIWRSVKITKVPDAEFDAPFITTLSTDGTMRLACNIKSETEKSVHVECIIKPYNFVGEAQSLGFDAKTNTNDAVEFKINNPQLWHPNGSGKQNLYTLCLSCYVSGKISDTYSARFGIRTVEMLPVGGESNPDMYDWLFSVNGTPTFVKGTGWCTPDALMRFTKERYDKFLLVAKKQNINIIRAWGCGLVETEDFYDLCDEYGIMVFQEWPTAWDSYVCQPEKILLETVERGVKRLRNRASLILWCGGNEGKAPTETDEQLRNPATLNAIGKRTLELDDTRPWHRQEPYAGSVHDYRASWGYQDPQTNMMMEATFFGEFGIDCWPNIESIRKYTPKEELDAIDSQPKADWKIPDDSVIAHHTPRFNEARDVKRQQNHVERFISRDSMENSVIGSQLAQVVGVRHTLERARSRFPMCTGAIMYKLNGPYPAASWETVDWYGSQKLGSFFVSDAFAPVCASVIFNSLNLCGNGYSLPVWFYNENGDGADNVTVQVFDENLKEVIRDSYDVSAIRDKKSLIGELNIDTDITSSVPLFVVASVYRGSRQVARSWYFANYEQKRGCLFTLPKTRLSFENTDNAVIIRNESDVPAVCVNFDCPEYSDVLRPDDGCIWINPHETIEIRTNYPDKIKKIKAFNM
ncbi:MAG: beta-mannosidase [Clostridia bacterium]|nr:beta-mannosidase [Clostridia bacterium]